ncbi:uncharacterized protein [Ptychodera flava]|uniref:uncharacterized protein n=1 Tax=Ptychodera flava TaxID=63121 RepID=UPI003969FC53
MGKDNSICLYEQAKVLSCGNKAFDLHQQTIDKYYKPEEIAISDVEVSPAKKRLTVTGTVEKVEGISQTANSSNKRDVTISDRGHKAKLRLWNEQTALPFTVGAKVRVGPLTVNKFHNQTALNSTKLTEVEVLSSQSMSSGILEAIDPDDPPSAVIDGEYLECPQLWTLGTQESILERLPMEVMFTRNCDTVTAIKPATDTEDVSINEPTDKKIKNSLQLNDFHAI